MHKIRIVARWARVTAKRYGIVGVFSSSTRPRHAGMGHGVWFNPLGRAHDALNGTPAMDLIRALRLERGEVFA